MVTNVLDLIEFSMQDCGYLDPGETLSAEDSSLGLATLNQMLALWQTENVNVYAQQVISFSPTGAVSYSVGTGADISTTRPTKIDAAYWRSNNVDYPITLVDTYQQYESIAEKTQTGEPLYAFYLPSYTNGTLYLFPQVSSGTVRLVTQVVLPTENTLAADLSLPPEYVLPIRLNLSLLLAGTYGAPVRPTVAAMAANTLRALKRNNLRIQPLTMPSGIPTHIRSNIITGY